MAQIYRQHSWFVVVVVACCLVWCTHTQTIDNVTISHVEDDLLDLDVLDDVLSQANITMNETSNGGTPVYVVNYTTNESNESTVTDQSIMVKNSFVSMTDEQLQAICTERGFDVNSIMTHDEYVEAAMKCVSIDDEINAIIAENPDLAAELDIEIERMRSEKERLERERNILLEEKAALEAKLRLSGVDPAAVAKDPLQRATNSSAEQSVEEVLRESFVLLFDRVGKDMQLVGRTMRYVLKPVAGSVQLVWRYASPTIEGVVTKVIILTEDVFGAERVSSAITVLARKLTTMVKLAASELQTLRAAVQSAIVPLYQRKDIRKICLLAESFLGPLCASLLVGWRSIKPELQNATTSVYQWFQHLKDEKNRHSTSLR